MISVWFIVMLLMGVHDARSAGWGCDDENVFVPVLGHVTQGKKADFLKTPLGLNTVMMEAEKTLKRCKSVRGAALEVVQYAKDFLRDNLEEISLGWCHEWGDIEVFANRVCDGFRPEERSFVLILLSLGLLDSTWKDGLFSQQTMPSELPSDYVYLLNRFLTHGQDYFFLVQKNTQCSFLEKLVAMKEGKRLVVILVGCGDEVVLLRQGSDYRGLLSFLRYSMDRLTCVQDDAEIMDEYIALLQRVMGRRILSMITNEWLNYGVENVIAAFSIFYERGIGRAFSSFDMDIIPNKVGELLNAEQRVIYASDLKKVCGALYPLAHDRCQRLKSLENAFWGRFKDQYLQDIDVRVQGNALRKLYQSWFPGKPVVYGRSGYQKMALEVMQDIFAVRRDIPEDIKKSLMDCARRPIRGNKPLILEQKRIISSIGEDRCIEGLVVNVRIPSKHTLKTATEAKQLLYLESMLKALWRLRGGKGECHHGSPFHKDFCRHLVAFYTL